MENLPSFKDIISIKRPTKIKIAPEGDKIAYVLDFPNWSENRYESTCYVYFKDQNKSFRLTKDNASVKNIRWLSNNSIALIMIDFSVKEGKGQIFLYDNLVGDGLQMTYTENGVKRFECLGEAFVFLTDDQPENYKHVHDQYGNFNHVESELSKDALFYTSISAMKEYDTTKRNFIKSEEAQSTKHIIPVLPLTQLFTTRHTIDSFFISDLSKKVFINTRIKDDLTFLSDTKSFIIEGDFNQSLSDYVAELNNKNQSEISSSQETKSEIVVKNLSIQDLALPKGSHIVEIAPSGDTIFINYHELGEDFFYTQKDIWQLSLDGIKLDDKQVIIANLVNLTKSIDREIFKTKWVQNSLFLFYFDHCQASLSLVDLRTLQTDKILSNIGVELLDFDSSANMKLAIIGAQQQGLPNVFSLEYGSASWKSTSITQITDIPSSLLGTTEQINWESRDGTVIEGVLQKPVNFDPSKKYPLVLMIHGGPTDVSLLLPFDYPDQFNYPTVHFINNDVLVLKPNYRGSIGRGADFMKLNVDNVGVGDLWDIESGVEFLINQGFVDKDKIGCMGWSQGGYISAFATVNSSMFKATSVGAGISNWYTYYISTDIRQWPKHYLSSLPYENDENYLKTSPMTNITKAKTPTLIQHGTADARVPYSNATELFRALKELGVQTEFFSFTNMPHGINKPKENRAVIHQNFTWFMHFLKGSGLDFFKEE